MTDFVSFGKCMCAGMLDHIIVEASGLKLPLSQIAVVSVMDSKTLSINPFDPNVMTSCLFLLIFVFHAISM